MESIKIVTDVGETHLVGIADMLADEVVTRLAAAWNSSNNDQAIRVSGANQETWVNARHVRYVEVTNV